MNIKRMISYLMVLFLVGLSFPMDTAATPPTPDPTAEAAILIDAGSGRVLFSKNSDQRMAPASTTKILTAIIALEKGKLSDKVAVGHNAVIVRGTRVYLKEGEIQTLENLLYAALINSANDAAIAIAEHIGGSIDGFAGMMNQKARAIGGRDSHFSNPEGLPDEEHYTTAADLVTIARYALRNPVFREIVATWTRDWHGAEWESRLINQNRLLRYYDGTTGVKTGYTREAGNCLVASARRGDQELIAVLLKSSGRQIWTDAENLLDYGFKNFQTVKLVGDGEQVTTLAVNNEQVGAVTTEAVFFTSDKVDRMEIRRQIKLLPSRHAVRRGQPVGKVVFTEGGSIVGEVPLVASRGTAATGFKGVWWIAAIVLAAILVYAYRRRRLAKMRRNLYRRRYRYRDDW